jgi:hypothetical protein
MINRSRRFFFPPISADLIFRSILWTRFFALARFLGLKRFGLFLFMADLQLTALHVAWALRVGSDSSARNLPNRRTDTSLIRFARPSPSSLIVGTPFGRFVIGFRDDRSQERAEFKPPDGDAAILGRKRDSPLVSDMREFFWIDSTVR